MKSQKSTQLRSNLSHQIFYTKARIAEASMKMGREPSNMLGNCFDAAAQQFLFGDNPEEVELVHGVGVANFPGQEGIKIAHAWLEYPTTSRDGIVAWDPIWDQCLTKEKLYKTLQVSFVRRYTKSQVLKNWRVTDTSGPWDPTIRRYCSD